MITYLVLVCGSHVLYDLLSLGLGNTPLLGDDLGQHSVHLSSHICGITAYVKVRLLFQQFVNFLCIFLESVLNIDFLRALSGKRGDQFETVAKDVFILLGNN